MIHVYKKDGDWGEEGAHYSIKSINECNLDKYLQDGWVETIEEVLNYPKEIKKKKLEKEKNE